jgi:hypothetical protein
MTFGEYLKHLEVLGNVGMTRIDAVEFGGQKIVPIQFLRALLPDPASLAKGYTGKTSIGCLCEGIKDGKPKRYFIYNICDHAETYKEVRAQAISYDRRAGRDGRGDDGISGGRERRVQRTARSIRSSPTSPSAVCRGTLKAMSKGELGEIARKIGWRLDAVFPADLGASKNLQTLDTCSGARAARYSSRSRASRSGRRFAGPKYLAGANRAGRRSAARTRGARRGNHAYAGVLRRRVRELDDRRSIVLRSPASGGHR